MGCIGCGSDGAAVGDAAVARRRILTLGRAWLAERLGAGLKAGARKSRYSGRAVAY